MISLRRLTRIHLYYQHAKTSNWRSRSYATRSFEPLRILFCGSDNFSIASLEALHDASQQDQGFIERIEVVSRPGKWTGPYKKLYKEVPIVERARSLGLPLHQIDTFRGWAPPERPGFNLIIAVSFGLLIPRRLIEGTKYGGLNVHPSMLPDLWGAAPLQHCLLDDDEHVGITVQTLHPTTMDKGAILKQSLAPGLKIPMEARSSFSSLIDYVAPRGAEMLLQTLRQGIFVQPTHDLTPQAIASLQGREARHARKLDIEDRHIDWTTWTANRITRYQKLFKALWNNVEVQGNSLKISWSGQFQITEPAGHAAAVAPGIAYNSSADDCLFINTVDGKSLRLDECTVAGDKLRKAGLVAQKYGLIKSKDSDTSTFMAPFT